MHFACSGFGGIALLGERYQALGLATNRLGLGAGGLNAFMLEELLDQDAAQGIARPKVAA
jgi:hypothetical protein